MRDDKIKRLTTLAMFSAIAFVVVALIRIPVVLFLKYEPKDVVITICGFIFGPLSAMLVSAVVSLVEMVTISSEGIIGCIMNIISTCSFACTASLIYKKVHSIKGAVVGLLCGVGATVGVMLLWNYLITPIHMGLERQTVAAMLVPVFLPFNAIKGALNTAITLLLYKPVVTALRRARLVEESPLQAGGNKKASVGVATLAAFLLITCVFFILVLRGIL